MKKIIEYYMGKKDSGLKVQIDYNEINLDIARREAMNGEYDIKEIEEEEGIF